jgi:hypothetical protein
MLLLWETALGHAILTYPTPRRTGRTSFEGEGIKIANFPPTRDQMSGCLDSTPSTPKETFRVGQSVSLAWEITIPHPSDPGVRVAIQFPGQPMQLLRDNIDVNVLQTSIVIPPTRSNSAVLQWSWASAADNGFYLACSDIRIQASTTTAPNATTVATSDSFHYAPVWSSVLFLIAYFGTL